ncbi:MAG: hypothetical protein EAX86_01870 [Candidatus Heimdallarchaeota archaeon]|nr:hypothetical protein [Candidatus Heimdallarchaeota archaeon]
MNEVESISYGETIDKKQEGKKKLPKRTLKDNLRQLNFNLTTINANIRFVFRVVIRELKYFLPLQDLFILFLMIGAILAVFLILLIWGVPFLLGLIPGDPFLAWDYLHINLIKPNGWIFNGTVLRWAAGLIGVGTVIIRLMVKSPIMKYRDKVNTRKDVTYIFGTSRPAEQFLFEMVHQFGYEERVSLIADVDLLWVRKLKSLIDIYIVENLKEIEKPNLYEIIGFKNASRVMILTENVELNQNILTNIRRVRPDVEIILLSQYAPAFVFSELVNDENLTIIEDLDTTIQGLVISLSLDFQYPPVVEIDVPRNYIGHTGETMTSDLIKQKVLMIKRGEDFLNPSETLKLGDRVLIYYYTNYYMKLTNRVVTELPSHPKTKKKNKKEKKTAENSIIAIVDKGEEI